MRRGLRLAGRNEHEASAAPLDELTCECLRRVLDGAHEERAEDVPVLEWRLLDRRSPAPAADEMDEPVHVAAVPLREVARPDARRRRVEEVDDVGLDRLRNLRGERLETRQVASADART